MLTKLLTHALEEFRATDMSVSQLRKFGFVVGGILLAIGGYTLWRESLPYAWFTIGALLVLFGWFMPRLLRVPYLVWMGLAAVLGFFVGNAILIALYYLVMTPLGIVRRLAGSDPLDRRFDARKDSYWKPHDPRPPEHMRRPF
jgi:hypothetical protein